MKIVTLKNVFLTRSGIGVKNLRLVNETIHRYPGKRRHFFLYAMFQRLLRKQLRLNGKYVIIHNHWCPGWYHWLTEAMPRLLHVQHYVTDHTLILPDSFKGAHAESLEPFFKGGIFWLAKKTNALVEELVIPENPPYSG